MDLDGIFVLALIIEGCIEYFLAPVFDAKNCSQYLRYMAMLMGVGLCMAYRVDLLNQLFGLTSIHPIIGMVVSGILMGRGSNALHDLVGRVGGKKEPGPAPTSISGKTVTFDSMIS